MYVSTQNTVKAYISHFYFMKPLKRDLLSMKPSMYTFPYSSDSLPIGLFIFTIQDLPGIG